MARKSVRELFFEQYPEPFLVLNNGIITDINNEASLLLGVSRSFELIGNSFLELIRIEDQYRVSRLLGHFHSYPCTEKDVCVRISEGFERIINLTSAALNVEIPSLRWVRLNTSSAKDDVWDASLINLESRCTGKKQTKNLFLTNPTRPIRYAGGADLEVPEVKGTLPTETTSSVNQSDCLEFSFACFFKSSPAVMLLINYETGVITDANPAAIKFYGYVYDELIGKSIFEISTLSENQSREEMEAAFRKQRQYFRFKHKLSCGEVRNVEVYSGPIGIKDTPFLLSIIFDGTERYRTEEALNESEKLFRKLFLNSGIGNAIVTPDRHYVDANPAYLRMVGYTHQELMELVIDQVTHPDDRESDVRLFTLLVYGDIDSYSIEKRFLTKKGEIVYVGLTVSAVRDENGIAKLIIGQAQDITARKKAERELKESEERFRLLAENARDLIYRYRLKPDPGFDYISPSSSRLVGYSPEEYYSDPFIFKKIVHPDDRLEYDRMISRPDSEKGALRLFHKEGHIIWMEHQIVKICDDSGETIAYEGISRDITARKEAEEALRRSEEKLSLAIKAANLGLWNWNFGANVVERNETWVRILGYSPEDLDPGANIWNQLIHPEDKERVQKCMVDHLKGDTDSFQAEYRLRARDGSWRWVFNVGRVVERLEDNTPVRATGALYDITEQKQTEIELRKLAGRYAVLSEMLGAFGLDFRLTPSGEIVQERVLPWTSGLSNFTPEEKLEKVIAKMVHPDDGSLFKDALKSAVKNEKVELEIRMRCECKSYKWVRYKIHPVWSEEENRVVYLYAAGQDITHQKEAEELLIEAKEKAEEMSRLKDTFLANMSHEIRTPLTSIIGFADLLSNEVDGVAKEFANQIRLGGYRLLDTLNALLDFAQLRSGTYQLNPQRINPADEARNVLQTFERRTKSKGLRMEFLVQSGCPKEICIDRTAFEKIINHLVSNAVKYTNKGAVSVSLSGRTGAVILKVEDTGIGMSREYQNRLFMDFSQESSGLARRYEGTGLGLAITRHLVDMLGGQIEVKSRVGTGTIFTITLPTDTPGGCQQSGWKLEYHAMN